MNYSMDPGFCRWYGARYVARDNRRLKRRKKPDELHTEPETSTKTNIKSKTRTPSKTKQTQQKVDPQPQPTHEYEAPGSRLREQYGTETAGYYIPGKCTSLTIPTEIQAPLARHLNEVIFRAMVSKLALTGQYETNHEYAKGIHKSTLKVLTRELSVRMYRSGLRSLLQMWLVFSGVDDTEAIARSLLPLLVKHCLFGVQAWLQRDYTQNSKLMRRSNRTSKQASRRFQRLYRRAVS